MGDFQNSDSDQLMKRLRPSAHPVDEVTYASSLPQATWSLDDLPRTVACTVNQGATVTSMDFHPSHHTLLLAGSQGVLAEEISHGLALPSIRSEVAPTPVRGALRLMSHGLEVAVIGHLLSEELKQRTREAEGFVRNRASLERQREELLERVAAAEHSGGEARRLVAEQRAELAEARSALESSASTVSSQKTELDTLRLQLGTARTEEARLQAKMESLQQGMAAVESARSRELEQARLTAVEDFKGSAKFKRLQVNFSLETYVEGYDLGVSKGFAAGFKRAVHSAREKLEAGGSLDDVAQGDEAYESDPEVPSTPQVELPASPLPEEDQPAQGEPSELTAAPTDAAAA